MGHACELETSIYLAIDPDAVDMDKAVDERGFPAGEYAYMDWSDGPMRVMPWWSSFSVTGIQGDATKATAEKGVAFLEAAVEECVGFVREPAREAPARAARAAGDAVTPPPIPLIRRRATIGRSGGRSARRRPPRCGAWSKDALRPRADRPLPRRDARARPLDRGGAGRSRRGRGPRPARRLRGLDRGAGPPRRPRAAATSS